jgi:hypothetical protein
MIKDKYAVTIQLFLIISRVSEQKNISLRKAMDMVYNSEWADVVYDKKGTDYLRGAGGIAADIIDNLDVDWVYKFWSSQPGYEGRFRIDE